MTFWDRFEEYDSQSPRFVKQVSGTRQDHRLEKYMSKFLISEVHALKFEDRSQGETAIQERCACGKARNLANNIYKLRGKDRATFYSPEEEWVLPAASTIEFVVDSGSC